MELDSFSGVSWIGYSNADHYEDLKLVGPMPDDVAIGLAYELAKIGEYSSIMVLSADMLFRRDGDNGEED